MADKTAKFLTTPLRYMPSRLSILKIDDEVVEEEGEVAVAEEEVRRFGGLLLLVVVVRGTR